MRAVRKTDHGAGHVECVEIDEPKIRKGCVKIKVEYCGICGSDSHIFGDFETPTAPLPIPFTFGHELSGTIVEIGEGVEKFNVGDRVTSNVITGYCGRCEACVSGHPGLCKHSHNAGYECDGAMAEYFVIEEGMVFALPDNISFEEGAQVEPACVAAHAVLELCNIKPSEVCVIMGCGPIGLLVLQFAKACGAECVCVDVSKFQNRLDLAKKYGADYVFANDQAHVVEEVRRLTKGQGVSYVFECTGDDMCFDQAVMMSKVHGKIVEIAITNDAGSTHRAFLLAVMMGLDIQCSFGHSYDTWPKVLQMMAEGKINTKDLVSHKFVFEDINKAIELDDPAKLKILMHP